MIDWYEGATIALILAQSALLFVIVARFTYGLFSNHRTLKVLTTAFIALLLIQDLLRIRTVLWIDLPDNWTLVGARAATVTVLIGLLMVLGRGRRVNGDE